jgi:hypothetical protein
VVLLVIKENMNDLLALCDASDDTIEQRMKKFIKLGNIR